MAFNEGLSLGTFPTLITITAALGEWPSVAGSFGPSEGYASSF